MVAKVREVLKVYHVEAQLQCQSKQNEEINHDFAERVSAGDQKAFE